MKRKILDVLKKNIQTVLMVFIGGFLLTALGGYIENNLKSFFGDYFIYIIIVLCLTAISIKIIIEYQKTKVEGSSDDHTATKTRRILLENLKQQYLQRLKVKMKNHLNLNIELSLNYSTLGTSNETIEEYFILKKGDGKDFNKMFKHYTEKIRRLLILGEPGAGKSVLLLRFALKLIESAENDPDHPIPFVLDLSSWDKKYSSFDMWLERILTTSNGSFAISSRYSKKLRSKNALILLLDGFDEIKQSHRNSCLQELTRFLKNLRYNRDRVYPEVIVSSRIEEYIEAVDAPVFATLKIENLKRKDIKSILIARIKDNDPWAINLQKKLEDFPKLYKVANSPFFLHILLFVDLKGVLQKENGLSNRELKERILENYISLNISQVQGFHEKNVLKWLSWLAWCMKNQNEGTTFELIDLQPSWTKNLHLYSLINGFLNTFSIILVVAPLLPLMYSLRKTFIICVLLFFISMSMNIFGYWLHRKIQKISPKGLFAKQLTYIKQHNDSYLNIKVVERISFTIKGFDKKKFSRNFSFFFILYTIAFSLDLLNDSSNVFLTIIQSIILGLIMGLGFGFLIGTVSYIEMVNTKIYYQRLIRGELRIFIVGLMIFIPLYGGFYYFLAENSYVGFFLIAPLVSVFFVLSMGNIGKYFSLLLTLKIQNLIPFNFFSFLNQLAEKTGLIIKEGGYWRFRHQMIQNHLVNWFEDNYPSFIKNRTKVNE